MNNINEQVAPTAPTGREMAATSMAAKQRALVESRYVMAFNRPRNMDQARQDILNACKRPAFAETARYKKPVGKGFISGFSIRFAEEAIRAMRNIHVDSSVIYEDDSIRTVQVTVTDLQSNSGYGKEITISKTVERKVLKDGQVPISKRQNSQGEWTFLVAATEDDLANKIASAESKIIRNEGLRLLPSDIKEEAEREIAMTRNKGGADPQAEKKKIIDAFATLGVRASDISALLKHSLDSVSPSELQELRDIYSAVKDGEAAFADYLTASEEEKKPGFTATPPAATEPAKTETPTPTEKPKPAKKKVETPASQVTVDSKATTAPAESPKPTVQTTPPPPESDDGDTAPQTAQPAAAAGTDTVQALLQEKLTKAKVQFGGLKKWLFSQAIDTSAMTYTSWDQLPAPLCKMLLADEKRLQKCITIYAEDDVAS